MVGQEVEVWPRGVVSAALLAGTGAGWYLLVAGHGKWQNSRVDRKRLGLGAASLFLMGSHNAGSQELGDLAAPVAGMLGL